MATASVTAEWNSSTYKVAGQIVLSNGEGIDFNTDSLAGKVAKLKNDYPALIDEIDAAVAKFEALAVPIAAAGTATPASEAVKTSGSASSPPYTVQNQGANSIVVDSTGIIVYSGPYDTAVNQAAELNRQSSNLYNQNTTVKPQALDGSSADDNSGNSPGNKKDYSIYTGETPASNVTTPSNKSTSATSTKPATASPEGGRLDNPLGDFSSVTYKLSLYALSPDDYNTYYTNNDGKWKLTNLNLIAQSGGSSSENNQTINPNFDGLDFYIDDLEIVTLTNAKESGYAGAQAGFKFKIFEPYGLTFPSRLVKAETEIQKNAKINRDIKNQIQALACHFLLVVRFYGYDVSGNIITSASTGSASNIDDTAAFERAFPIMITKFSFKLNNKVTEYDIDAVMAAQQIALGAKRGRTPHEITIKADTVGNALDSTKSTVAGISGLVQVLNEAQKNLVTPTKKGDKPSQEIADEYSIIFADKNSDLANALIADKEYLKSNSPMSFSVTESGYNVKLSESAKAKEVQKQVREISIPTNVPITQAIDQIIAQSDYTHKALKAIDKEQVQPTQEGGSTDTINPTPKELYWYNISTTNTVKNWDHLRNDYAYKITYIIQKYKVPYIRSVAVGQTSSYPGPSKRYYYYYTGKNSEILSYEQQYNLLYFNAGALSSDAATTPNSNDTTATKKVAGVNASVTGKLSGALDQHNTIRTFLYSPGDQINAQIKILGDPDYLMTGLSGVTGADTSINPNVGQIFIEVDFNQVEDYDTSTGLMTPNHDIQFWDYSDAIQKQTNGAMVYMLIKVTSHFSRGSFTQDLKTVIPNFPNIDTSSQSNKQRQDSAAPPGEASYTPPANSKTPILSAAVLAKLGPAPGSGALNFTNLSTTIGQAKDDASAGNTSTNVPVDNSRNDDNLITTIGGP
jgi:hypothetical protein